MPIVSPIPKDKVVGDLKDVYDAVTKKFGRVPNMIAVMAHRPAVLKKFLPFHSEVMTGGTVEHKYKELAYLKASMVNGCEY